VLSAEYVILVVNKEVDVRLLGQLGVRQQLDLVIDCVLRRKNWLLAILGGPSSSVLRISRLSWGFEGVEIG